MSYTKIKITGTIEVKTGLHIGGDDSFSAIGSVDSPVVRDPPYTRPRYSWIYTEGQDAFAACTRIRLHSVCGR